MTVAADPDPYYALPKLYGAPAYSRGPKAVPDSERPFDPDDLPIAAEQTDDERAVFGTRPAVGTWPAAPLSPAFALSRSNGGPDGSAPSAGSPSAGARRLSLRTLAERLGPRSR